jgi:hypothetical protein
MTLDIRTELLPLKCAIVKHETYDSLTNALGSGLTLGTKVYVYIYAFPVEN